MKFTYELQSIGWAKVYLQISNSEVYVEPSYLSEPLIDLVKSLESLVPKLVEEDEIRKVVEFDWDSEPAIYNWKIGLLKNNKVQIVITLYSDGLKTDSGEVIFCEACDLDELILNVVRSMDLLLKKHGLIGYRKQWNAADFPVSSYLQLKRYIVFNEEFPTNISRSDEWIEQIETDLTEELILLIRPFDKHSPEEWISTDNK